MSQTTERCTRAAATLTLWVAAAASAATALPPPLVNPTVDPPRQAIVRPMAAGPTLEEQVIMLVNGQRWSNGKLPPLAHDALLDASARTHGTAMAGRNFFAHCDPDTKTLPWDRMTQAGYAWRAAGENIAAGYADAAGVVTAWMNSPGHRANILSANFSEIGVGYVLESGDQRNVRQDADGNCSADSSGNGPYFHYWTQNFGTPRTGFPIVINREAYSTNSRQVSLYLYGGGWAKQARLRNESGSWSVWQPFSASMSWELSAGDGEKSVYMQLRDAAGTILSASDRILLVGSGTRPPAKDSDGDGIPDATDRDDDNDGVADWADPGPLDPKVGIAPVKVGAQPARAGALWVSVNARSGFVNAIVIAGPPTFKGVDPGVVRLRQVSPQGFQVRFQEWDYRQRLFGDVSHTAEAIPYIVLKPGSYRMSDGSIWEIGSVALDGTGNWQARRFSQAFPGMPRLFLTAQTSNGGQAVSVRARGVHRAGFQAALFEEEALMDGHAGERIGYLAIFSPSGNGQIDLDGKRVSYLLQRPAVGNQWVSVRGHRLKVEEEQSRDAETAHAKEVLDVLFIGSQLLAQQVTDVETDPAALRWIPASPAP